MGINIAKKKYLLFILLLSSFSVFAQSYTTAGGMRLGTEWGLTLQQRILDRATIEGIFQSSLTREELTITALFEHHNPLISKRLNFYAGGGLHKGWTTQKNPLYKNPFGFTLIAGLEFTIARLVLSYDFKPALNITGGEKKFYLQTGVSLRYVFVTQKAYNKRKRAKRRAARKKKFKEKWDKFFGK